MIRAAAEKMLWIKSRM